MNRRTFLAGVGVASIGGLAGCTGAADDNPEGVRLPRVELGNATAETHTFHVIVEFDGEIHHWDSYEIEPGFNEQGLGSQLINPNLPDEAGDVVVHARIGAQRSRIDFDREGYGEGECVIATFLYGFRGDDELSSHPTSLEDSGDLANRISCP